MFGPLSIATLKRGRSCSSIQWVQASTSTGRPIVSRLQLSVCPTLFVACRTVGWSAYRLTLQPGQSTVVWIGATFLRPDVRASFVNPETKLLMLGHAFNSGAVRVQFTVDARNERSQAAVAKLGAVREGILRRDTRTWTGHLRDTVVFSILDSEWPAVKLRLEQRLAKLTG